MSGNAYSQPWVYGVHRFPPCRKLIQS